MATLASLNISLGADSAKLKKDLNKANAHTQTWAQKQKTRFNGLSKSVKGLGVAMAGIGAAMGTKALLDNADAMRKASEAAGMGFEEYQRLQFGLGQAGISSAAFGKSTVKLGTFMEAAGRGTASNLEQLEAMGLQYEDLAKMSPEDRYLAIVDGLNKMEDASQRQALAQKLLGKEFATSNVNAAQVVKDGEGIVVMNKDAADAAEGFNDSMARLNTMFQNIMANAILPLMDHLTPLIESFSNLSNDNPTMANAILGVGALGAAFLILGGPITAVVAGIAGIVALYTQFESFRNVVDTLVGAFTKLGSLAFANLLEIGNAVKAIFSGDFGAFQEALTNIIKNTGEVLLNVFSTPINYVIQAIETALNKLIGGLRGISIFGKQPFGTLENFDLPRFAQGGPVSGPGTGTSDSIPALLSNGEFVMNAASTRKFGPMLDAMNKNRFANGGFVGGGGYFSSSTNDKGEEEGSQFGQDFVDGFRDVISTSLKGGNLLDALDGFLNTITSKIVDSFASSLTDSLFSGMGSLFGGGGGGGGGLGGIFSSIGGFFGFSNGGLVPKTPYSKLGQDSVPAMLTPGEVVVPVDQVSSGFGGGQTFNINVSGDVSRQTRSEIVKMLPQIAAGTNMLNKESGIR